ncbi:hypothetical protein IK146_01810 [Candidatus Saccharibacteria bacterium]|nr:hypothetical protein [Candidatus Saccharibacteria bacterium]
MRSKGKTRRIIIIISIVLVIAMVGVIVINNISSLYFATEPKYVGELTAEALGIKGLQGITWNEVEARRQKRNEDYPTVYWLDDKTVFVKTKMNLVGERLTPIYALIKYSDDEDFLYELAFLMKNRLVRKDANLTEEKPTALPTSPTATV